MNKLNKLLHNIVEVSSKAAIACYDWIGMGNEKSADKAAVESMRLSLNELEISGKVVIGEGERDQAPMLYIGEMLGKSGMKIDIAVDPLEGTTLCAHNRPDSICVLAIAEEGTMLNAPDVYMEKIAVGSGLPRGIVDLEDSIERNLKELANFKRCSLNELIVCTLKRPRHYEIIKEIRMLGVKVKLIDDGDILGCLKTCLSSGDVDIYFGIGGAPEGVIAAAALKCLGGQMQGKLIFNSVDEINRAHKIGINDLNKKYDINDMVQSEALLAATWVTDGFLKGVKRIAGTRFITNNLVIMPNILRIIKTEYR